MKRFLILFSVLVISAISYSQSFKPVDDGSTVKFKIKNLGFNVTGTFSGLEGAITFDPNNLSACNFDVSVDANSVNSGIDMRDDHLRKEEYFDVKNHPRLKFVSTKVAKSNKAGTLFIFGKLTIKGITKDISFPFTAAQEGNGYIFSGECKLNRRDFNVGGGSTISDNLTMILTVKAVKN